jgi:hypothetical protein
MFRTSIKIIGPVLVAAVVAVPVASAGSPRAPSVGEGFSFRAPSYWNAGPSYWNTAQSAGVPTTPRVGVNRSLGVPAQYLGPGTSAQGPTYSLGPALLQYRQGVGFFAKPTSAQGPAYSLGPALLDYQQGVGFYAKAAPTARGNGFDWSSAGIGAGIAAALFLIIAGIGAMTIRARQGHQVERLSAT